jgi:hypothetical protein
VRPLAAGACCVCRWLAVLVCLQRAAACHVIAALATCCGLHVAASCVNSCVSGSAVRWAVRRQLLHALRALLLLALERLLIRLQRLQLSL